MKDNRTIDYYNKNAEVFFQDTACADMSYLYKQFLPLIPVGGRILDLGCGSGRDSRYFLEQGFQVTAIDGSAELCRLASKYIGQEVLCMVFRDLAFENCFDGVWACASLLHVPRDSTGFYQRYPRAYLPSAGPRRRALCVLQSGQRRANPRRAVLQ